MNLTKLLLVLLTITLLAAPSLCVEESYENEDQDHPEYEPIASDYEHDETPLPDSAYPIPSDLPEYSDDDDSDYTPTESEMQAAREDDDYDDSEFVGEDVDFFAEYDLETSTHPEVQAAKKYFPTRESTIDRERFVSLMKMFVDGTIHDEEIDEDIREEAHKQLEEWLEQFMSSEREEQQEFTVQDLHDIMIAKGGFHDWLDENHPQLDFEIEQDL